MTSTPTELRDAILYDPSTGEMWWKERAHPCLKHMTGQPIGSNHDGHLRFMFMGEWVLAHRAAWAISHGVWPCDQIDHINGVRSDNRLSNLRECDHRSNCANRAKRPGICQSDFKGVSFDARTSKWYSKCRGKRLGSFKTEIEAARAYDAAASDVFGEFARLNFAKGA